MHWMENKEWKLERMIKCMNVKQPSRINNDAEKTAFTTHSSIKGITKNLLQ